jgi:hypothetical protein
VGRSRISTLPSYRVLPRTRRAAASEYVSSIFYKPLFNVFRHLHKTCMAFCASACHSFGWTTRSTQVSAALHGSRPWHAQGGVDLKSPPKCLLRYSRPSAPPPSELATRMWAGSRLPATLLLTALEHHASIGIAASGVRAAFVALTSRHMTLALGRRPR